MSRLRVALLAEVGRAVGTGHLKEVLRVSAALRARGTAAGVWTLGRPPRELAAGVAGFLSDADPAALGLWAKARRAAGARVALLNLWDIRPAQCEAVAAEGLRLVAFDERGGKNLPASVIINPLLLPRRHHYGGAKRVLLGPRYLPMQCPGSAPLRRELGRLLITFGGVDRSGATSRAMAAAATIPGLDIRVILGPGFEGHENVAAALARHRGARFSILTGVRDLAEHLVWSDVVLNSGGNTLCEAASHGRPVIVAHEDPHEAEHGRAFAMKGFGVCVGRGASMRPAALRRALARLRPAVTRLRMARAGRRLVDGRGTERVAALLERLSR